MTTAAQVTELIQAHIDGDKARFRNAAARVACGMRSERDKARVRKLIELPRPEQTRVIGDTNGMLTLLPAVDIGSLTLPCAVRELFDDVVLETRHASAFIERGLRPRKRLLLHGPTGNGKTSSAVALASMMGANAYGASLGKLIGSHLGETGKNITGLFSLLPGDAVLVLDELDSVGSARFSEDSAGGRERNSTVNVLLTLLDRHRDETIFATTNRLDMIDPALIRRFDEIVLIPAPTEGQLRELAHALEARYRIPDVSLDGCASYDDVAKRVESAARRVVLSELRAKAAKP